MLRTSELLTTRSRFAAPPTSLGEFCPRLHTHMLCRAEHSVALSICNDSLSVREEVAVEYRALENSQHDDRSNAWMKHYIVRAFESQNMEANATWIPPPTQRIIRHRNTKASQP